MIVRISVAKIELENPPFLELHSTFDSPQFAEILIWGLHQIKFVVLYQFDDLFWPFLGFIQVWNVVKITDFDLILAEIYNIDFFKN